MRVNYRLDQAASGSTFLEPVAADSSSSGPKCRALPQLPAATNSQNVQCECQSLLLGKFVQQLVDQNFQLAMVGFLLRRQHIVGNCRDEVSIVLEFPFDRLDETIVRRLATLSISRFRAMRYIQPLKRPTGDSSRTAGTVAAAFPASGLRRVADSVNSSGKSRTKARYADRRFRQTHWKSPSWRRTIS